jgi:hypothetical protein
VTFTDPDPAIFVSDLQDVKKKIFSKVFCLLLFEGTFISFFNGKSHTEVTKQKESTFVLLFLLDYKRTRIRIRISEKLIRIRIRIQEAQKHMDPIPMDSDPDLGSDPDPQQCFYKDIRI